MEEKKKELINIELCLKKKTKKKANDKKAIDSKTNSFRKRKYVTSISSTKKVVIPKSLNTNTNKKSKDIKLSVKNNVISTSKKKL